jgi:ketosteroid isomerase-like protein
MTDDHKAIEETNAGFYRAFEALDLRAMEDVWSHGEHVQCVHPGWPLLIGWGAVRASWEAIFANTQEMSFSLTHVRSAGAGDLAWVTCTENILSETDGRVGVTAILATNLFERSPDREGGGGWRMVHHHASHVLSRAAL